MSKPVNVTSADFENRVLQSPQPVVVDFWAAWCGPCRMMAPVLENLAADLDGQVAFAKLNVDENPGLAQRYGVSGIPTLVVFANGAEAGRIVGLMFLGAAVYFAYGLVDRRWENAGGQLAGFLAYDVVLVVPFLVRLASGTPSYYDTGTGEPLRLNLLLYTGVVAYSGLLAAWYLFLDPRTRSRRRRP